MLKNKQASSTSVHRQHLDRLPDVSKHVEVLCPAFERCCLLKGYVRVSVWARACAARSEGWALRCDACRATHGASVSVLTTIYRQVTHTSTRARTHAQPSYRDPRRAKKAEADAEPKRVEQDGRERLPRTSSPSRGGCFREGDVYTYLRYVQRNDDQNDFHSKPIILFFFLPFWWTYAGPRKN